MIKFTNILLAGALLTLSSPIMAESQDYKCYIDSSTKGKQVVFYRWDTKNSQLREANLPGTQLLDSKGKKYYIKDVEECVPLSQQFSSQKAQAKDKQTLR